MAGGGETIEGLAGPATTGGSTINACLGAKGSAGGATGEGLTSMRGPGPGIGVLKEGERAGRENGSRLSGPRLGAVWKQARLAREERETRKEEGQPALGWRRLAEKDRSGTVKAILDGSPARRRLQLFHGGNDALLHQAVRPANRRWRPVKAQVRGFAEARQISCALQRERDPVW